MSKIKDLITKAKKVGAVFRECPEYSYPWKMSTQPNILTYSNSWSDERMAEEIEKN